MDNKLTLLSKEENKTIRKLFSGTIKESFLIEILYMVLRDPKYISVFVGKIDEFLSIDSLVKGKTHSYLDICKMIVMCHYKNAVMLSESQKGELQSSITYKNKLCNQVVEMFLLKTFATPSFSNTSLEPYYPLAYYISALNNYCALNFDLYFGSHEFKNDIRMDFNRNFLSKLILKVRSCISLADIRSIDDLVVIYRSYIELFMTYVALWDAPENVINTYYDFDRVTFNYNRGEPIPIEYRRMASENGEGNNVSFINYGWLKELPLFDKLVKSKNMFKLSTLGKILDLKYGHIIDDFGTGLYNLNKACNPQAHGTALNMNFFELEISIFQNISIMMKFMCRVMKKLGLGFEYKLNDIDLLEKLDTLRYESEEIFAWVINNQENELQTNLDYKNRAICSAKLG